jgi:hypothetical protein
MAGNDSPHKRRVIAVGGSLPTTTIGLIRLANRTSARLRDVGLDRSASMISTVEATLWVLTSEDWLREQAEIDRREERADRERYLPVDDTDGPEVAA